MFLFICHKQFITKSKFPSLSAHTKAAIIITINQVPTFIHQLLPLPNGFVLSVNEKKNVAIIIMSVDGFKNQMLSVVIVIRRMLFCYVLYTKSCIKGARCSS
jgi:hypothetical protein